MRKGLILRERLEKIPTTAEQACYYFHHHQNLLTLANDLDIRRLKPTFSHRCAQYPTKEHHRECHVHQIQHQHYIQTRGKYQESVAGNVACSEKIPRYPAQGDR